MLWQDSSARRCFVRAGSKSHLQHRHHPSWTQSPCRPCRPYRPCRPCRPCLFGWEEAERENIRRSRVRWCIVWCVIWFDDVWFVRSNQAHQYPCPDIPPMPDMPEASKSSALSSAQARMMKVSEMCAGERNEMQKRLQTHPHPSTGSSRP